MKMEVAYTKTVAEIITPAKDEDRKVKTIVVDLEKETYTLGFPPIGTLGVKAMEKADVDYWTAYLDGTLKADASIKNVSITAKAEVAP